MLDWILSRFLSDIRYSARSLLRTPGLALALLLTIAIGIGSNVAIRGFIGGLTERDTRGASVERVVSLFGRDSHREAGPLSYEDYVSLKGHANGFEWIGAARVSQATVMLAGQSSMFPVAVVTPDLAGLLKLSLDEGVVISHRMWQSEFRARADVRGERIRIDGVDRVVSGVAPGGLEGVYRDRAVDLWMPLQEASLQGGDRGNRNFWLVGRLRRDVSISQAQAAIRASRGDGGEVRVVAYSDVTPELADILARIGAMLGLAAGAVMFIACANVASFLLGRASVRSHETSVRATLGASRGQLARGLLADSVVVSVTGGACSALLAIWTLRVVPAFLFEQDAERLVFATALPGILSASAACAGIMVVCGLLPVLVIPHDRPGANGAIRMGLGSARGTLNFSNEAVKLTDLRKASMAIHQANLDLYALVLKRKMPPMWERPYDWKG
jgi:hypothetical protein